MFNSLRSAACLAILVSASALASAGPVSGGQSFFELGTGNETYTFDLAPGKYMLNDAFVVQMSSGGRIDNVKFDGKPFAKEDGGAYFDLKNFMFTVPAGEHEVLDLTIKTSQTVEHYFVPEVKPNGKVIEMERTRKVSPSYLAVVDYTLIPAVPEPTNMALMLSGLLGLGFLVQRRKASAA